MPSSRRVLLRATALVAGSLAALVAASPAMAISASANLGRLPSRMSAGGDAANLIAAVTNTDRRETLTGVQVIYTISLDKAQPDQIRFSGSGLQVSTDEGRVRAVQNIGSIAPRVTRPMAYQLQFLAGAPSGRATVNMEVIARDNDELRRVARDTVVTLVTGLRGTPTPTASGPPLATEVPGAAVATTTPLAAAGEGGGTGEVDSGLWPLYLLGTLLLVGGGGFLGWLLLRRPRFALVEGAEVDGYPRPAPPYGYQPPPRPLLPPDNSPTAVIPIVPTEPTDPWADSPPEPPGRHRGDF